MFGSRLFGSPPKTDSEAALELAMREQAQREYEYKKMMANQMAPGCAPNSTVHPGLQNAAYAPREPQPSGPLRARTTEAMSVCYRQLPHKVLQQITTVTFDLPKMVYVVHFKEGRQEEFEDIDNFPSDADISRILLVCP